MRLSKTSHYSATARTGSAYYLAYGSNLNLRQMLGSRCPNATPMFRAVLEDWRLVFRGVADIEPYEGASVPVGIFKITPECERALDRYEGYPTLYTKAETTLQFESGETDRVMFYVMTNTQYYSKPADHYFQTIKQGYDDFGMTDDDVANLARCAFAATQWESRNVETLKSNGLERRSSGKYLPAKVSSSPTLSFGHLKSYDEEDLAAFCRRHGINWQESLSVDSTLSDLVATSTELRDETRNDHK